MFRRGLHFVQCYFLASSDGIGGRGKLCAILIVYDGGRGCVVRASCATFVGVLCSVEVYTLADIVAR